MTPEDQIPQLTIPEFANRIRTKYPAYKDLDDNELTRRVLKKHPNYRSRVNLGTVEAAETEVSQAKTQFENAASAYTSAAGRTLNPPAGAPTDYFRRLTPAEKAAQRRSEPVIISEAAQEPSTPTPKMPVVAPQPATRPRKTGVLEQGNIDLTNRPKVKNRDGSVSTVRSISVNMDGREVLLPTVSDDGRILTKTQAVDQYRKTGKHLGIFDSPGSATAYAQKLHQEQAKTLEPPVSLAPVIQSRLSEIQKQRRQQETQAKVQQARQAMKRQPSLVSQMERAGIIAKQGAPPIVDKSVPGVNELLPISKPRTFEQDRAMRVAAKTAKEQLFAEAKKRGVRVGEIRRTVAAEMSRPETYQDQYGIRQRMSTPDSERVEAETVSRTQAAIAEADRKQRVSQMGNIEYFAQLPKGPMLGLASAAGGSLKGLAAVANRIVKEPKGREIDTQDTYVYQLGEFIEKNSRALLRSNPDLEKEFFVGKAPEALGQSALFLLGGWASKSPKLAVSVLGGSMTAGDAYDEVRALGGSDEEATNAALLAGAILGPTELIGTRGLVAALEGKAQAATLRAALKNAVVTGSKEGVENAVQEIGQEAGQGLITGNPRSLAELAEAGALGFTSGLAGTGATTLGASGVDALRQRRTTPDPVTEYLKASPLSTPEEKAALEDESSTRAVVGTKEVKPESRPQTAEVVEQVSAPDQKPEMRTEIPSISVPIVEKPQQTQPDQIAEARTATPLAKAPDIIPELSAPTTKPTVETPAELKTQPTATESQLTTPKEVTDEVGAEALEPISLPQNVQSQAGTAPPPSVPAQSTPTVLRAADSGNGGIIAPSPTGKGWRLTRFDSQGFSGHGDYSSREEAERDARGSFRFTEPMSAPEFEQIAASEAFAAGNELSQYVNKQNLSEADRKRIAELNETLKKATAEKPKQPVADISPSSVEQKSATVPAKPKETKPVAAQLSNWSGRLRSIAQSKDLNALQALSDEMAAHKDDPRIARLRQSIQDSLASARQIEIPEPQTSQVSEQKLSQAAQKTLKQAESPEGKTVRPAPTHRIGAPKLDSSRNSLEQQARAYGGLKDDVSRAYAGEIGWLKESSKRGTVNQTGGISVEEMATRLAQDGYGKGVWWEGSPNNVDPQKFLQALMDDARGSAKHYSTERDEIEDDPDVKAWDALVEDDAGKELIERVQSGHARAADIVTFVREASAHGLSDKAIDAFVDGLQRTVQEELSTGTQEGEGYTLDEDGTLLDPDGSPLFSRAFHGSPYEFDKFSTEKIGTGEGAQAYGYGLYFTDRKEIADYYRDQLSQRFEHKQPITYKGVEYVPGTMRYNNLQHVFVHGKQSAVEQLEDSIKFNKDYAPLMANLYRGELEFIKNVDEKELKAKGVGRTYEVELAPKEDEYLLWDKPLSEQSEKVRKGVETAFRDMGLTDYGKAYASRNPDGQAVYATLASSEGVAKLASASEQGQLAASKYLHSLGIRGIKYLDEGSRGIAPWEVSRQGRKFIVTQANPTYGQAMIMDSGFFDSREAVETWKDKHEPKPTYNYVIFSDNDVEIVSQPQFAREFQLGFAQEGLTQQEGPRPKTDDQRDRLKREQQERDEAADPQRATARRKLEEIRRRGMTVDEYARQGSMFEAAPSEAEIKLLKDLERGAQKPQAEQPRMFARPNRPLIYQPTHQLHIERKGRQEKVEVTLIRGDASAEQDPNLYYIQKVTFTDKETDKPSNVIEAEQIEHNKGYADPADAQMRILRKLQKGMGGTINITPDYSISRTEDNRFELRVKGEYVGTFDDPAEAREHMEAAEGVQDLGDIQAQRSTDKQDVEGPIFGREGNRIALIPAGSQLLSDAYREQGTMKKGEPNIRGVFDSNPEKLAKTLDRMAADGREHAAEFAEAIREAAKKTGRVLFYGSTTALRHELFHEASAKTNKVLEARHSDLDSLTENDTFSKMYRRLVAAGYPAYDMPTLVEEAAAYIAEGRYDKLGITREEAVEWIYKWFQSFEKANPNVNPREFQELADEAREARDQVYSEAAQREQVANKTLPGIQERREGRDRESVAAARSSITDTEAFKRWFGDSKVVDEKGKPLVVYHGAGTREALTKFEVPLDFREPGIWFTKSKRYAAEYGRKGFEGSESGIAVGSERRHVVPVYLSVQNPLDLSNKPHRARYLTKAKEMGHPGAIAVAKEMGFDGIIFDKGKEILVFEPAQIKSATGNRGTFDPNDPNILMARSEDPWADLSDLADEFERIANEPELAPGEKPLSLPQTLKDAGLEAGPARGYLPESIIDDGLERAKQVISDKGIDGAMEFVRTGDGIEWASTGFEVSARLRQQESDLRAEGKTKEAEAVNKKRLDFLDDFALGAVERGRSIVGIKAIAEYSPDRMAYALARTSRKKRKRGLSPEEEATITKLGEELGLLEERNRALEKALGEATSRAKARGAQKTGQKPKKTDYQSRLDEQASTVLQTLKPKLGKLDLSGLGRESEKGAVKIGIPPLPGDAELIAQYAAAQLGKLNTVADLNQHLVQEFGQDIEQYLPKIRQRAYAIRSEARQAEVEASETEPKRRKTILAEIQKEIAESLTIIRETQKAEKAALKAERAAERKSERAEARLQAKQAREAATIERKQQAKEARADLKRLRQEYKQAAKAETAGYRESIKAQREAERTAQLWDTPLRNQAAEARERLKDATDPKDPQTAEDLIAVAAEKFLPAETGGTPRTGVVEPAKVYRDLKDEFPGLVTKKNQGKLYKQGYQRIQDATAAAREAARLRAASAESKRLWDELGVDEDAQAVLIRQAEVRRQTDELRRKAQAEFQRVSKTFIEKLWMEAQAIPRSLQSSIDAPIGRQGAFFLLTHPLETVKTAVPATLKGYGSIHVADYITRERELTQHPDYKLAIESGLELSSTASSGDPALIAEEQHQSALASRIFPHVRLSEQGYVLGMNAQRLAIFSRLADIGRLNDYTPESNPEFFEAVAQFVNDGTGRGHLPDAVKRAAALLNFFFFSTRLNVSRIQLLNDLFNPMGFVPERFNPLGGAQVFSSYDPVMRKVVAGELVRLTFSIGTVLLVAAALGIKVEFDPEDPDGLLLRVRNTRYDITGGEAGTIKFLFRFMKSIYRTAKGDDLQLFEQPLSIAAKFIRYKLAPLPSGTIDTLTGKDAVGQPANLRKFESPKQVMQENVIIKRTLPIFVGNVLDTVSEEGWIGVPMVAPAIAGFGVSSYPDRGIRAIKNQSVVDLLESLKINSRSLMGVPTKIDPLDKEIQKRIMEKVETLETPTGATEIGKEKIVKERLEQIRALSRAEAAIAEPKLYAEYLKSKEGSESVSVLTDEEKKTLTKEDLDKYREIYAEAYVQMLGNAAKAEKWPTLTDDQKEKVLARIPRIAHTRAKVDLVKTKRKP